MCQISTISSTARSLSAASRIPAGNPFALSSTCTRCGTLRARSLSGPFRIPNSAFRIFSRFIVDQRIPPLREPRPWLHLDDVVEQRALEPEFALLQGDAERAPPSSPRGGARVAGEELQFGGARREGGELDREPLHCPAGRRLLEPGPERRGDAIPVGGRGLERRFDQPRRAALELGSDAHHPHPPADATWEVEWALEQLVQRMREQLALGDRREERDRGGDRLGCRPAYDALDRRPRPQPPQAPAGRARLPEQRFPRE